MMTKEEIDKMVLKDRQERENRCAKQFDELWAKFQKDVLDVERCNIDVEFHISNRRGVEPRFIFYARE